MEIRTRTKRIETQYYVAFDGKEFEHEEDCVEYEKKNNDVYKTMERRIESMMINEADGYMPCDGKEHNENYCYSWFRAETEQDLEAINDYYQLDSYNRFDSTLELPCIVGVEYDEAYRCEGIYSFTMADCERHVKHLFEKLGKKIIIEGASHDN